MARVLPIVDAENEHFWLSGADGELRILRCGSCAFWIHPPTARCRRCHSGDVAPQAVSGRATVRAFTVNHHKWRPDMTEPFVIASVELEEQRGLFLTTNVVDCDIADVHTGMAVHISFLQVEDVWLPLFVPSAKADQT